MKFKSKYSNLEQPPKSFTLEEWQLAVTVIEFLPHDTLVKLCNEHGVKYRGGNEGMDDENLSRSLLGADVAKDVTMQIVSEYKTSVH